MEYDKRNLRRCDRPLHHTNQRNCVLLLHRQVLTSLLRLYDVLNIVLAGDRLQISTVGSETAGTIAMVLDSQNHGSHTVTYDLFTDTIDCGLQVDHFLDQDTYNVTLILAGPSASVNNTNNSLPEFHVLDIT